MASEPFVDYYELLDISPDANMKTVESAVRVLLRRYSPQSSATADARLFELTKQAFITLSNPVARADFTKAYKQYQQQRKNAARLKPPPQVQGQAAPPPAASPAAPSGSEPKPAEKGLVPAEPDEEDPAAVTAEPEQAPPIDRARVLAEWKLRRKIVTTLYQRCLVHPLAPQMTAGELGAAVEGAELSAMTFSLWFLRETGLVSRTDKGEFSINVKGAAWLEDLAVSDKEEPPEDKPAGGEPTAIAPGSEVSKASGSVSGSDQKTTGGTSALKIAGG